MTTATDKLHLAQAERQHKVDVALDQHIDNVLDFIGLSEENCLKLSQADTVGPGARHKLRGILRHYAKEKHPFRACVKDNRKRFGARVNAVCAVVKDIIRGTTKWRGHPALDHGAPGAIAASELPDVCTVLDQDIVTLLEQVDRSALADMMTEIDIIEVEGVDAFATMTAKQRKNLPKSSFVFPDKAPGPGSYPIHDHDHRVNALARASGKPEYSSVKSEVCKREPGLPACQKGKS